MSFEGLIIRGHHTSTACISHILDSHNQRALSDCFPALTLREKKMHCISILQLLSININLCAHKYAHIRMTWLFTKSMHKNAQYNTKQIRENKI